MLAHWRSGANCGCRWYATSWMEIGATTPERICHGTTWAREPVEGATLLNTGISILVTLEELARIAPERAEEVFKEDVRGAATRGDDLPEHLEEQTFIHPFVVQLAPILQAFGRDAENLTGQGVQGTAAERRIQCQARHLLAQPRMVFGRPVLHQCFGCIQGTRIIKQSHPEGGQGAKTPPGTAIGTPHLEIGLQPHLGEDGGHVICPVAHQRLLTRQDRETPFHEVPEGKTSCVEIFPGAMDEVHRYIE